MAVATRGPDILTRSAPPLSAVSDMPLADIEKPPASASNDPADHARGVAEEMSPQAQAAARAAKVTDPDAKPVEAKPVEEPIDLSDLPENAPYWYKREVGRMRQQTRAAKAGFATEAEAAKKEAADASAAAAKAAADAKAEAEAARAELARIKAEIEAKAAEAPPEAPEPPAADPRPARDAFDDPDAYDSALEAWSERKAAAKIEADRVAAETAVKEAAKAAEAEAAKAAQDAEIAKVVATWTEKRTAAIERYPDYVEVTEADKLVISDDMAKTIVTAPNGTDIAYYLGKNLDESKRIAALPSRTQQIFEIGALSAKLAATPARAPRPKPLQPIETGSNAADTSDREETMAEVEARVSARIAAQRKPFIQATRH